MTADPIYLGAFSGVLASLVALTLVLTRLTHEKKFLLLDLILAGFACVFIVDKQFLSSLLGLSAGKTFLLSGICPLFASMIGISLVVRISTNMKEASPKTDKAMNLAIALLITGLLLFLTPILLSVLNGPPGMDAMLEGYLMPKGVVGLAGLVSLIWLIAIAVSPVQLGELRSFTVMGVVFSVIFIAAYCCLIYGVVQLNEQIANGMRVAAAVSVACLTMAMFRRTQFARQQRDRSVITRRESAAEFEDKQRSRQAISQAHLMRVLKREKELEAELRKREAEQMEALKAAKEAADETAQNKAQFLAFISHEIRTPLNGIMGMVRLLMNTDVSEQQRDYIQTLNYSGDALLALVNDTLDISKIEAGQLVLESIDFDLQRLVSSIIMLMSARASEKGLLIRSDIGSVVPRFIKGDPTRLRQILLNLINNAIKFTEEGGVTVAVRMLAHATQGSTKLRFEIQDTGPGIPEAARDRLFKEYSQVDASTTRLYGGTGLGLSICKQLVEAMKGEIGVESFEGQGSSFWFVIEFLETNGDAMGEMPGKAPGTPVLSAMVIEDNEIHQKVIGGYLRLDGHDVTLVGSAEEALEQIAIRDFDVLLMDVNLPGIDGNEATRRIRKMSSPLKQSVPIIAITGNTAPADIDECRTAGMDDFVGKPVDPDVLRATVFTTHRAWQEKRKSGEASRPVTKFEHMPKNTGNLRVLVVDDNNINQKVVGGFLKAGGYFVDFAATGEKAVSMATNGDYDLVLMDVTLPGIDGMEATRQIRALPDVEVGSIPIIAITGHIAAEDIEACRAAGMNDFLAKPIDPDSLNDAIERVRSSRADVLDDYLPHQKSDDKLLDEAVLKHLTRAFDAKALTTLMDDMVAESTSLISQMGNALEPDQRTQLRVLAHTLKGMAITLGVMGVGDLAADIESSVQRNESQDVLVGMVRDLESVFQLSRAALDRWQEDRTAQFS